MTGHSSGPVPAPSRVPGIVSFRVIALDDSTRLDSFFACRGADVFRVFRAVDGRKGEGAEHFNLGRFETIFDYTPTAAEIAIAASHLLLMREFAQEEGRDEDLMVVAEDDAQLSTDFDQVLRAIVEKVPGIEIVTLAHPQADLGRGHISGNSAQAVSLSMMSTRLGRFPTGTYRCGHYAGVLWGTGLYLVTRAAARRYSEMVEATGGVAWVADDWARISRYAHLDIKFLRPNLAGWIGDSTFRETAPVVHRFEPRNMSERIAHTVAVRTRVKVLRKSLAVSLRDLAGHVEGKARPK